jgi:hypothetical protein
MKARRPLPAGRCWRADGSPKSEGIALPSTQEEGASASRLRGRRGGIPPPLRSPATQGGWGVGAGGRWRYQLGQGRVPWRQPQASSRR